MSRTDHRIFSWYPRYIRKIDGYPARSLSFDLFFFFILRVVVIVIVVVVVVVRRAFPGRRDSEGQRRWRETRSKQSCDLGRALGNRGGRPAIRNATKRRTMTVPERTREPRARSCRGHTHTPRSYFYRRAI